MKSYRSGNQKTLVNKEYLVKMDLSLSDRLKYMGYTSFNDLHLMNEFNGDEDILLDMINMFEKGINELIGPIRESILNEDGDKLRVTAHTIKGVLANFYAEEGKQLASELEKRGEQSLFDDALHLLNQLENQLLLFLHELKNLKEKLINNT